MDENQGGSISVDALDSGTVVDVGTRTGDMQKFPHQGKRMVMAMMIGAMGLLAVALPRHGSGYDEDRQKAAVLLQEGAIQPLEGLLDRARALHGGRVIEVELETKGGRHFYEVELLDDDGQVWEITFDATSGELVEEEREH